MVVPYQWHNIVVFGKLAETCAKYLGKGRQIYVEGRLRTRSYEGKEDGVKRYVTEIIAQRVQFLGPKPNGERSDGIDLAVPQGTEVRAAEDGIVAYAGNELKGYGNLVLVRHANGFVTAYAHASDILVKRGDAVKRGQVIAHSGQTGNVTSPQLHFEIRKGATPVDPAQYLSGA